MTDLQKLKFAEEHFRGRMVNPKFKAFFCKKFFTYNKGYTSQVIFEQLYGRLQADTLHIEIYEVPWYKPWRNKVRAYILNGRYPIYINERILKDNNIFSIAGTIAHEFAHICGYSHGGNKPEGNNYFNSVPYQLGKMVKDWQGF